jgi:hypothetical protein
VTVQQSVIHNRKEDKMPDITVPVPEDRLPEFYQFFGAWLAGSPSIAAAQIGQSVGNSDAEVTPWGSIDDDLGLAQVVWGKLSERAKAMFSLLMEHPGKKVDGETIAATLDIPNGKYGVAGVLAWPGRHCYAVGRSLPVRYEDGPVGGSANYWIDQSLADLFGKARDLEDPG